MKATGILSILSGTHLLTARIYESPEGGHHATSIASTSMVTSSLAVRDTLTGFSCALSLTRRTASVGCFAFVWLAVLRVAGCFFVPVDCLRKVIDASCQLFI
jgi:hypothetical protein